MTVETLTRALLASLAVALTGCRSPEEKPIDEGTAVGDSPLWAQLRFRPTTDTFVDSATPSEGKGGALTLEADTSPSHKRVLMRFSVSGLPDGARLTSVRLRLNVVDGSEDSGTLHAVNGDWDEGATWSSAPGVGGELAKVSSPAFKGETVEASLDALVKGNGVYDLYLVSGSLDGVDYASAESGSGPLLVITYEPPESKPVTLIAAGDIGKCGRTAPEGTAKLIDDMVAADPDAVVAALGDIAYDNGTKEEFASCYHPSWGRHRDRTRPAVGNHEYHTPRAAPYFEYFGAAAGEPDKGYYSYQLGAWHVVVLNSNCAEVGGCGVGSAQERWLREDLAAHPSKCTLAYWHHPLFSSGPHGPTAEVRPLWRALEEAGAELALYGHDHHYERFLPMRSDGTPDAEAGIRGFVVGTGGTDLRRILFQRANSEVFNTRTHGVLKLSLDADGYAWDFRPIAGQSFVDSGTGKCH